MFDLISIGDCVIDLFVPLEEAEITKVHDYTHLCLPYGYKVPVGEPVSMVGGNAANNAVGSSRLGLKTAIYTNVGKKDDDASDNRIVEKFKKEGVDIRYVVHNSSFPTNHNIILDYNGERTILVHHHEWDFKLPELDVAKWLYLTSMASNFIETNLIDQIINYLERTHAKLAYQPGTFQIAMGLKKNARIFSLADIVVLNLEEAKKMLGYKDDSKVEIKKLLSQLLDNGPKKVVITNGKDGSYGFDGEKFYKLELFPAKLMQKTGAGDAYATATVAGLISGKDFSEAMRWGAANAAAVVEHDGPQSGLLTVGQMKEKLKENSKIMAREI